MGQSFPGSAPLRSRPRGYQWAKTSSNQKLVEPSSKSDKGEQSVFTPVNLHAFSCKHKIRRYKIEEDSFSHDP